MNREQITSPRLGESFTKIEHPSGLTLLLCPMAGFSSAYALFATKYGSVDTSFKTGEDEEFVTVPEGIAHFLEHKLFESEDGDAFGKYAKTGASANAYTSFDRTAYLFSCSDNFAASLEVLLDFVTHPYFTPQTVEKEQGIIGQEIQMYDDSADWRVYFNLLGALYHNNPVRIDIAGTIDSIAKIDADLLHRCYKTFYNLHNMVLAVAGNFGIDTVLEAADRILPRAERIEIERMPADEPESIREKRVEKHLPVALPLFQIGFKGRAGATEPETMHGQVLDEILLDIIAGESTPLYRRLYDEGLINQTFGGEAMSSRDYAMTVFSGESRDPDKVLDAITQEVDRLRREGIEREVFSRCKKAIYGRYVGAFGRVDAMASMLMNAHFAEVNPYDLLDLVAAVTPEAAQARLHTAFDTEKCALSVVRN